MTARDRLTHGLVLLADQGRRPPCGDWTDGDNPWLSDNHDQRARAVQACATCPLLEPCAAAADEVGETFGVWGGRDYSPRPKGRPRKAVA